MRKKNNKSPKKILKQKDIDNQFEEKIIDWTTFYRRNIHRFIEHYFGIKLHLYQIIIVYLMNIAPQAVLLCARAISKSFTTSLYGCAICVLYPNSKVLVTSFTKKQAGLLITEKIEKELMVMSPNLRREIKKISTGQNATEVIFHNGSSFIAAVAGEQARGLRSTVLIIDEFRLVKKDVIQSILSPTEIIRPTPYTMKKEYEHLQEEPREIYLSSAFWKYHWMWEFIKKNMVETFKGESVVFATDYALTVKHGLKTKNQIRRAKKDSDSVTFDMEYLNLMQGGSDNQYYSFELVSNAQRIKKSFYPKTIDEYFANKKSRFGDIKKQPGEVRVVSMDIALSESTDEIKNDASVIKCIRAIPSGEKYERQEVYIESFEGVEIDRQAVRVRQVMEDFEADYFAFDGRTYGTNLTDSMAKILYDEDRDVEYPPLKVFNNETYAKRCKNPNAIPIMWVFIAGTEENHKMHTSMFGALKDGKYKMLISRMNCGEQYLDSKKEYDIASPEEKARLEMPYQYSDSTLNEMVRLKKEFIQNGKIKLSEPSTGTKDKYTASAIGNYFVQEELEVNLIKEDYDEDEQLVWS